MASALVHRRSRPTLGDLFDEVAAVVPICPAWPLAWLHSCASSTTGSTRLARRSRSCMR